MKTPSEILLERHASARSKLDAIRNDLIAQLQGQRKAWVSRAIGACVGPLRWHFAGLSAAWLLVALLNFERPAVSSAVVASDTEPRSLLIALLENRRQLAEMTDSLPTETNPSVPPVAPRRRSDLQPAHAVV